jgi:hypothetical protein
MPTMILIEEKIRLEPIQYSAFWGQTMKARTFPISLILLVLTLPVRLLGADRLCEFEHQLVRRTGFFKKRFLPIRIRPPPLLSGGSKTSRTKICLCYQTTGHKLWGPKGSTWRLGTHYAYGLFYLYTVGARYVQAGFIRRSFRRLQLRIYSG